MKEVLWRFRGYKTGLDNFPGLVHHVELYEPFCGTSVEPFHFVTEWRVCILQDAFFFSYRICDSSLECSKNMIQVGLCVIVISEFGHRKLWASPSIKGLSFGVRGSGWTEWADYCLLGYKGRRAMPSDRTTEQLLEKIVYFFSLLCRHLNLLRSPTV